MTYENRIVLFLDILGFQKIIDETVDKDKDQLEKIKHLHETLQLMKEEVSKTKEGTSKKITQFSDTIVISFRENDKREIIHFFQTILRLILKLLNRGILCRGAISYGKLFHDDDFVFGPALNDAYLTESTAALYPRVILDKSVLDILRKQFGPEKYNLEKMRFESKMAGILNIDTDDKHYFDYFAGALTILREDDLTNYFKNIRKTITAGSRFSSPSIKIKYGWLKNKFNQFIKTDLPSIQANYNLRGAVFDTINKIKEI